VDPMRLDPPRFPYSTEVSPVLTVVTGPPCAGKSTYVAEHRAVADLVIDLDAIAYAFGYPDTQVDWDAPHPAVDAARMARAHVIHALLNHSLDAGSAWIIDADPRGGIRAQYDRAGAHTVSIDPGRTVCLERAARRSAATRDGIEAWYARHPSASSHPSAPALDIFD
jgi:predicted kinase